MNSQKTLRIIIDQPQAGPANMAVDEAILQAVNSGWSGATLRFYRWSEPTISLGYFQKYAEVLNQDEIIQKMPLVRRQTGGGAILHDDELTYSLVLPLNKTIAPTNIEDTYQMVHDAYLEAMADWQVKAEYRRGQHQINAQRGPFFCFSRKHRFDLVLDGKKLLGSAQRRAKNAVLQHGSLIIARHFTQQESAQLTNTPDNSPPINELIDIISQRIGTALHISPLKGSLTEKEISLMPDLEEKYAGSDWNQQR